MKVLRGACGLLFDAQGNRVSDELGRQHFVTAGMFKNKLSSLLTVITAASDGVTWLCKLYTGRRVVKFIESVAIPRHESLEVVRGSSGR